MIFAHLGNITKMCIKAIVITVSLFILVISFFELNNVLNSSIELASMSRIIMTDACIYAAQESYRGSGTADAQGTLNSLGTIAKGNMYSIYSTYEPNTPVVTGKFYNGDNEQETYEDLFNHNANFTDYINFLEDNLGTTYKSDNTYKMLKDIAQNGSGSQYFKYHITPLNMGFTYIDPNVLSKVFWWYFTNKLTATGIQVSRTGADYRRRSTIYFDENNEPFIRWKGWRIYIPNDTVADYSIEDTVDVTPSERCYLLNLTDEASIEIFEEFTGLNVSDYLGSDSNDDKQDNSSGFGNKIKNTDIRINKILYDVRWKMKIAYEGILPIAITTKILKFNSTGTTSGSFDWSNGTASLLSSNKPIRSDIINPEAYKLAGQNEFTRTSTIFNSKKYNEIFIEKTEFTNMDTENSIGNFNTDVNTKHFYDRTGADMEGGNTLFSSNYSTNDSGVIESGTELSKETYGLAQNLHYCVVK